MPYRSVLPQSCNEQQLWNCAPPCPNSPEFSFTFLVVSGKCFMSILYYFIPNYCKSTAKCSIVACKCSMILNLLCTSLIFEKFVIIE